MNDDLISRKATYEAFATYLNRSFLGEISSQSELRIGEIASVIHSVPTAFDKEKVIEELLRKQHEALKMRNDKDTSCTAELKAFWQSRLEAYTLALEIVEKGGIE